MKKKIVSIIGTRPNFIKVAAVNKIFSSVFDHSIIDTMQHYDNDMSGNFISEFKIQNITHLPDNSNLLNMAKNLYHELDTSRPDAVIVYGDTDSTLAGALAAQEMRIPVMHIEAGLRSGNLKMKEERNRILVDILSDVLFCPTKTAFKNIVDDNNIKGEYYLFGDIMVNILQQVCKTIDNSMVKSQPYFLMTLHRAETVDDYQKLLYIINEVNQIGKQYNTKVIFPIHPRTKKTLENGNIIYNPRTMEEIQKDFEFIIFIKPLSYYQFISHLYYADLFITDSGGAQKESHILGVKTYTLRNETEWTETLKSGQNKLIKPEEIRDINTARDYTKEINISECNIDGIARTIKDFIERV